MSEHRAAAEKLLERMQVEGPIGMTVEVKTLLASLAAANALLAVEDRLGELVAEQRKTRELMAGVYDPKSGR